jgi:hypothetical protein
LIPVNEAVAATADISSRTPGPADDGLIVATVGAQNHKFAIGHLEK